MLVENKVALLTPDTGQEPVMCCDGCGHNVCVSAEGWDGLLEEPLVNLLSALNATIAIFKKALFFVILRVCPAQSSLLP